MIKVNDLMFSTLINYKLLKTFIYANNTSIVQYRF